MKITLSLLVAFLVLWVGYAFIPGDTKPPVVTLTEKTIRLATGIDMEYVEQGDKKGVPLILLHGYTDSWHSFEKIIPRLPGNIRVFALSQRGHGNSSKTASGYEPGDFAEDIAAFIRQKKLGKVFIAGHSFGGVIAQQFALNYPHLVKGMVIISSDASYKDNPGMPEFYNEILKLNDPVPYAFATQFQVETCFKPIDTSYLSLLISESLKMPAPVWKTVMTGLMSVDFRNELGKIDKPVLIMWGDKDAFIFKADQDLLVTGIRNSKLVVYKGTGHALHWEQPEIFTNDLVAFINQNKNKNDH